jgi:hypothetical protein
MRLFALTLSACAPESADVAKPIEPEPCPRGRCLEEGTTTFRSGGEQREVEVLLPEQTAGAPVVFVWHHLGGTPEELMGWLSIEELRADGWVVFAPRSRGLAYSEWEVEGSADSNADVGLFDDLRARGDRAARRRCDAGLRHRLQRGRPVHQLPDHAPRRGAGRGGALLRRVARLVLRASGGRHPGHADLGRG